jgi:hypothetical protein
MDAFKFSLVTNMFIFIRAQGPQPTNRDYLKNAESEHLIGCTAQIGPMKSVYSEIQGFDWLLVSRVVDIMKIVMVC